MPQFRERPVVVFFRTPAFNPSERFIQAQAAGLVRYAPVFVGLEDKGNTIPELAGRMMLARNWVESARFRILGDPRPMAARLATLPVKLLHAQFGTDGLRALPLARALGVPLVTTLRGYEITRSSAALLGSGQLSWMQYAIGRRRLMREGALFLAVSEAMRGRAIAAGYPQERTITHYNGVDLERFRPGDAPEPGLILHVGRLVEKKGTEDLLAALAIARRVHGGARLVIVGEGPLRSRLEERAAALGVGPAVRFAGAADIDGVAEWMRRAWLLAAPSRIAADGDAEGLPNTVVEAASSGLPVAATRHAGIPEAVIEGETGILVEEGNAEALAAAIIAMLGIDSGKRRAMGAAARALAEARFDIRRQNALLEDRYDRLIAG